MHKVSEGDLDSIARPTVIFSHTEDLEIPELADAKNDPPKNHQDNGNTPPVNAQTSPPHSPPEYTSVASAKTPPCPCVKAGNYDLQAHEGELLYIHILGAAYMLYAIYHNWVLKNPGDHLDGGIAEYSKW